MQTLTTASELELLRDTIRSSAAEHHPEDNARGREAVESDPAHPSHTHATATANIRTKQSQIALDQAAIAGTIQRIRGGETPAVDRAIELLHRIATRGREVAYWQGVDSTARR